MHRQLLQYPMTLKWIVWSFTSLLIYIKNAYFASCYAAVDDQFSFHFRNYQNAMIHNQAPMTLNQNGMMVPISERPYYRFSNILPIHEEPNNMQYAPSVYQGPSNASAMPFQGQDNLAPPMPNMFVPVQHEASRNISPYSFEDSELLININKHKTSL